MIAPILTMITMMGMTLCRQQCIDCHLRLSQSLPDTGLHRHQYNHNYLTNTIRIQYKYNTKSTQIQYKYIQNNHNFHSRDMLFNHSHQTDKEFQQNNHNHPSDDEPGVGVVAISIKPNQESPPQEAQSKSRHKRKSNATNRV